MPIRDSVILLQRTPGPRGRQLLVRAPARALPRTSARTSIAYIDPSLVGDELVRHEDKTAEYVLAEVDDDYDEVVVMDANDIDADDEVVLLDVIIGTPTLELEVA